MTDILDKKERIKYKVGQVMNISKAREDNYDLLRIISSIAVIAIHVNAGYLSANIAIFEGGGIH